MADTPTGIRPIPPIEQIFCHAFAPEGEGTNRTTLDLLMGLAHQVGLPPLDRTRFFEKLQSLEGQGSRFFPGAMKFAGNQDLYLRATFHETDIPRDWGPDIHLKEGAQVVFKGRTRNGALEGDLWLQGATVFGIPVTIGRRSVDLIDWLIGRVTVENRFRVGVQIPFTDSWVTIPFIDPTDEILSMPGGQALLKPVPIGQIFSGSSDLPGEFVKKILQTLASGDASGLRDLVDRQLSQLEPKARAALEALDQVEIVADPSDQASGRIHLKLDWRKFLETIRSGRFSNFDFGGIETPSHIIYNDLPIDLFFPGAYGATDVVWSYDPEDKISSVILSDIDTHLFLPPVAEGSPPIHLKVSGRLQIDFKHPSLVRIYFTALEYRVEGIEAPLVGTIATRGRIEGSFLVSAKDPELVPQQSHIWVEDFSLTAFEGGPIRLKQGRSTIGLSINNGRTEVDYDPARIEEPLKQSVRLEGNAFLHGPHNRANLNDVVFSASSLFNLGSLMATLSGDLKVKLHGWPEWDLEGLDFSVQGRDDEGRVSLESRLSGRTVPFFGTQANFSARFDTSSQTTSTSCRIIWGGHLTFSEQPGSRVPIRLSTDFSASSDFSHLKWRVKPQPRQQIGEWVFNGIAEGEGTFEVGGVFDIENDLKQSIIRTVGPVDILKRRRRVARGLTAVWKGTEKEGLFHGSVRRLFDQVRVDKIDAVIPWESGGARGDVEADMTESPRSWRYRGRFNLVSPETDGGCPAGAGLVQGTLTLLNPGGGVDLIRGLDLVVTRSAPRFCGSGWVNPKFLELVTRVPGSRIEEEDWVWFRGLTNSLPFEWRGMR